MRDALHTRLMEGDPCNERGKVSAHTAQSIP